MADMRISEVTLKNPVAETPIQGVILLTGYQKSVGKNGNPFMAGALVNGVRVDFKAWNNSAAFKKLDGNDYSNCVV